MSVSEPGTEQTEITRFEGRDSQGKFDAGNTHGTPWLPGQSGNPEGRPKRPDIAFKLCKELDSIEEETGITKEEAIAQVITKLAMAGNPKMIEILLDRVYGKVQQDVNINIVPKMYGQDTPVDDV